MLDERVVMTVSIVFIVVVFILLVAGLVHRVVSWSEIKPVGQIHINDIVCLPNKMSHSIRFPKNHVKYTKNFK